MLSVTLSSFLCVCSAMFLLDLREAPTVLCGRLTQAPEYVGSGACAPGNQAVGDRILRLGVGIGVPLTTRGRHRRNSRYNGLAVFYETWGRRN